MDRALLFAINGLRSDALDPLASTLGSVGLYAFPLALLGLALARRDRAHVRELLGGWLAFLLAIFVAETLLKPLFARPRPCAVEEIAAHLSILGSASHSPGFPSGTAAACAAGATWIALRFGASAGVLAALFGLLASLARIYAGAHWPSDILAGATVGAAVAAAVDLASRWALSPAADEGDRSDA